MSEEIPTVVTRERVKHFLCELDESEEGFEIFEHGEHEFVFPAETGLVFINFSSPSILQIRAIWRGISKNDDDFGDLAQQIHMCNVQRSGPKAYLIPLNDANEFSLGAEVNLVISKGATNAQLTNFYETALTMILGYFQDVETVLPHLIPSETNNPEGTKEA
ncbi:MAG: YbjN domain-containing protein [Actinomycetaceae bacterium]|nr:YbjN domain-containing protein [Actinomycetaceae bacterium]